MFTQILLNIVQTIKDGKGYSEYPCDNMYSWL